MDRSWIKSKYGRVLTAVLINAIILVMYLVLFSPSYEVNDDSALSNLVNGSMGAYDPHVIFQNYLLGLLYTSLYRMTASVAWYALIQYVFMFLSLTVLSYCLMDYLDNYGYMGLVVTVLIFFGYDLYVRPQFSKTAAVLIAAGLALLYCSLVKVPNSSLQAEGDGYEAWHPEGLAGVKHAFTEGKIRKRNLLFGGLLVLVGAMYRMSVFKCALLIFSAACFYFLLTLKEYEKPVKRLLTGLVTGFLLLCTVFAFDYFDSMQYRSEDWAYYREFNAQRVKLSDYGFPQYKGHEERYEEIGFDLSAIKLLRRWTFQDAERYNAKSLRQIVELKKEVSETKKIDGAFLKKFLKGLARGLIKLTAFWCFMIAAVICLIWGRATISKWLALVYEMLVLLAVYAYTFYKGRFMMHRIDVGIWLMALLVLLLIYKPEKTLRVKEVCLGLAVLVLVLSLGQHWGSMRLNDRESAKSRETNRRIIEKIHEDQEHLYLKTIGTVSFYKAYGVFDPTPVGIGSNQYSLGGWMAQTAAYRSVLDAYDVRNPLYFRDMIDNDQVLLIDQDIDIMVEYLRRWYEEDARAEKVDRIGKWNVYKIVTN